MLFSYRLCIVIVICYTVDRARLKGLRQHKHAYAGFYDLFKKTKTKTVTQIPSKLQMQLWANDISLFQSGEACESTRNVTIIHSRSQAFLYFSLTAEKQRKLLTLYVVKYWRRQVKIHRLSKKCLAVVDLPAVTIVREINVNSTAPPFAQRIFLFLQRQFFGLFFFHPTVMWL